MMLKKNYEYYKNLNLSFANWLKIVLINKIK